MPLSAATLQGLGLKELDIISDLTAREILDSRGNPTVEVDLCTKGGLKVTAAVPSGASTGIHEACELRDGDKGRYVGKGVTKAVAAVNNELKAALVGMSVSDQKALDDKMNALDGTPNKSKLGANAILGVSMAACKAAAEASGMPLYKYIAKIAGNTGPMVLPVPCFNVINGGSHAGNKLAFQEYFIIPVGAATFKEAMRIGAECYHKLKGIIKKKYGGDATLIGDEGGFAPPIDAKTGVDLIMEAIAAAGYKDKCKIGMDVAASEFKVEGEDCYDLGTWYPDAEKTPDLKMTGKQLGEFYGQLAKDYPIITIEDPFDQDDWAVRRAIRPTFAQFWAISAISAQFSDASPCHLAGVGDDDEERVVPGGRRRPDGDEPEARAAGDRRQELQRAAPQGQPDRHDDRGDRGGEDVQKGGVGRDVLAPLGRDRGHDDRRHRRRPVHRPDQDGRAVPLRPQRQVQPAHAHRGGARLRRRLRRRHVAQARVDGVSAPRARALPVMSTPNHVA